MVVPSRAASASPQWAVAVVAAVEMAASAVPTREAGTRLMPYANPELQRAYQREWIDRRRRDWLDENGPCAWCGSDEGLEVDHIDPEQKVSHRIWSWSAARRAAELAKCRVLCRGCHRERTSEQQRKPPEHGTWQCYGRRCREHECRDAWRRYRADLRARTLAA